MWPSLTNTPIRLCYLGNEDRIFANNITLNLCVKDEGSLCWIYCRIMLIVIDWYTRVRGCGSDWDRLSMNNHNFSPGRFCLGLCSIHWVRGCRRGGKRRFPESFNSINHPQQWQQSYQFPSSHPSSCLEHPCLPSCHWRSWGDRRSQFNIMRLLDSIGVTTENPPTIMRFTQEVPSKSFL